MNGDKKVIEYLNQVLSIELTSINQYFLHARMFKNWGFSQLDEREYKKSIKDMKQADKLIERVLFLEGLPNLQHLNRLRIGENTQEMLQCDKLQVEEQLQVLKDAIAYCESVQEYVSRKLLCEIEEYEEAHLDWIDCQLDLISVLGLENYQQSQM
ncbi:MAG: bacterioferritin [Oceanisphaera sp.]|uniref:bacterioferritin n=1 Tax=Oceanisphaera sp. TaxID=1929979 RepID=UPI003C77DF79